MKISYAVTSVIALLASPLIGVPGLHAQNAPPPAQGATLTPLDPAAVDDTSRSSSATTRARINFVNQSNSAVDIYWITYDGNRMLYCASLAVGAACEVRTFLTHPWLVLASDTGGTTARDTGVRLAGFEASTPYGDTALITGVASLHTQDASRSPQRITLTPLNAATVDDALRSSNAATPGRITFVNQSNGAVDIYWINFDGNRVLYRAALAVGDTWEVRTFLTHPWLVVASGTGGTKARDTGVRLAGFEALSLNGDTALIVSP